MYSEEIEESKRGKGEKRKGVKIDNAGVPLSGGLEKCFNVVSAV